MLATTEAQEDGVGPEPDDSREMQEGLVAAEASMCSIGLILPLEGYCSLVWLA